MGYPKKLLYEDEQIDMEMHPHWKALVVPVLVLIVTAGAASFLAAIVPENDYRLWIRVAIGAVALIIVVRWSVWPWLNWVTTDYVFTTRRLIIREGVITREGRDIPLARINDVSFEHSSLLDRILGCGTLTVESAGERGQIVLDDIRKVEDVQRELYNLAEDDAERRRREIGDDDYAIDGT